jgi:ribonuclease PH
MRQITFERNFVMHPAGSCLVSFGDTRVLCTATLQNSVPSFLEGKGKGWLTAEYAMLPGSTNSRKRRSIGKQDGRSVEIQRLIGRSLRAAVDLKKLGEVTLYLDCDVIQADGGTRTASISGAYVALYDALRVLASDQGKPGPEYYLQDPVAAVSVGVVNGSIVCDLDYAHDSRADVDMNVVMRGEHYVEIQGTGEQDVFGRPQLIEMLDAAEAGIRKIYDAQKAALEV